ncbi:helix-turn-helix domain-containing protein [Pseudonocardia nigra]|uniref:helix-turn-helix domain-containing protein n=1 Tax=Pseudonocardia nigra TaxID=1921578 RepID=UPI001C5D8A61|nr:helix-turn-helix transcriptional regulator [Pseudonocardia nigra]
MGGSVILRRQLARELRRLRESSGYTLEEAATKMEWSVSKLSRIEIGLQTVDIHYARSMLDLYDLGGDEATRILDMTRAAAQRGWWKAYGLDDRGYVPLETAACLAREFSLAYVPGLLQTGEYARAVFGTSTLGRSAAAVEKELAARMYRQRRLTSDEDPLELVAVVDESALLRPVGGRAVMRTQLEHLVIVAELPTVTLHVLPLRAGAHQGMDGSFTVLSFGELDEPDIAYIEHPLGATQVDKEKEVARATLAFDRLRSLALDPADTVALVTGLLDRG